jgi:hypothetical protein
MNQNNKEIKVIKNFLLIEDFNIVKNIITSYNFSWFYQKEQNLNAKDGFFFSHKLYDEDIVNSSNFNSIINPFKKRLQYKCLRRCVINLLTRGDIPRRSIFHRDLEDERVTTGILYINENNGYTEFETGEKIKSIPNMYVEFSSKLKHRAVSQTDIERRMVINFNYYK